MNQSNPSNESSSSSADDNKLVSLICRTIQRPELEKALGSIASQTYPNIELVLVDALGKGLPDYQELLPNKKIHTVSLGKALSRPEAANAGLDNANGDYLMFLDDDDWIANDHVANLVQVLAGQDECRAVYSSTRKTDSDEKELEHVFNLPFDAARLRRDNFIPIHAMLFEASLIEEGCRFDTTLHIYEDWDFWLQVSQHTPVLHSDKVTAFYREGGESDTTVELEKDKYRSDHPNALAREKVFAKWMPSWSAADINQMLGSMDHSLLIAELQADLRASNSAIRTREQMVESLRREVASTENKVNELLNELGRMQTRFQQLSLSYEQLVIQHAELDRGIKQVLNSFSWRVTSPYRYLRRRLDRYVLVPVARLIGRKSSSTGSHGIVSTGENLNPFSTSFVVEPQDSSAKTLHFGLDSPSNSNLLFSDAVFIQGWAFTEGHGLELTAYVDELELSSFTPKDARPDVGRLHPNYPQAEYCGFFERISLNFLNSGPHKLTLVLSDSAGSRATLERIFYSLTRDELYGAWLQHQSRQAIETIAAVASKENPQSCVHILVCGAAEPEATLSTLHSIAAQLRTDWKLHYIGSDWIEIENSLLADGHTLVAERAQQESDLASALESISGQAGFLLALEAGECLFPHALSELIACAEQNQSAAIYSDHDSLNEKGTHTDPVYTFGWSPDHLMSRNYVGDVVLVRISEIPQGLARDYQDRNWRYGMLLETGSVSKAIHRVPKVLWSSPKPSEKVAEARIREETKTLEKFISLKQLPASISTEGDCRYIDWNLQSEPKVSIIIPTMGTLSLLQPCLDSIVEKTNYINYELIMLDNSRGKNPEGIQYLIDRGLTVIDCDIEFNWPLLNNIGAQESDGELLLFLNDDIEVTDGSWLQELVKQAQRPEVGAVGCSLLYPNGAIQHAGVFLVNYGGGGLHLFHKMMPDSDIYLGLHKIVREVSANTGACLMVSREHFNKLNGFDEELAVVGNDVDFCLRLLQLGYRNIWTPRCSLIHHESISRKSIVPEADEKAMWKRWRERFEAGDTYYNPNLTLTKWDCSLAIDIPPMELISNIKLEDLDASAPKALDPTPGVNLIGYIRAEMGLGEGARSDARALQAAEIDFGIINFEFGNPGRMTDTSWRHKEMLNAPYDINLWHINADFLPAAKKEIPSYIVKGRYNIAYWAWELEEIPADWLPAYEEADEIWVPSDFVKSAVEKNGSIPVVRIPHCLELETDDQLNRDYFELPDDRFIFLAMFDTRSIAERKNPQGAIEAFKQAFSGDDESVCLVLKVNNTSNDKLTELRSRIQSHPNILLMERSHSRIEINSLLSVIDCYVSLHRSEGFGLGPAEAMCLGKPTIITNWSGSTDYMTADNCVPVDYELVKIEEDYGPYKAGLRWAEPSIDHAAAAMRQLATDPQKVKTLGENARRTIEESFSPAAVGEMVKLRLEEIRQELSAK